MKAIIMAGGEGTRLRPVSANKPKPMVGLLDRPVLEHILGLLKKHGVTEACLTLKYLPHMITDYFASGEKFGMRLHYRTETEALGTAGGVLNCADFIGSEDFIVISGDCVCDFDLGALTAYHLEKRADVTLALYSHREPCEYGLVMTEKDGSISRFVEKPAWEQVLTDQINTGIYVMSPSILEEIPKGVPYDFGRDLFPGLLAGHRRMYGYTALGYWCDIGSVSAYISCCQDMLRGDIRADIGAPVVREGVWSLAAMPEGAVIEPPVFIGANAVIDKGATIGPFTVIGASSVIASGAVVRHSVISGAVVGENACVTGAVVCKGASVGRGTEVCEGAVVGENCLVGEGSVIAVGARLWPDRQIQAGTVVTGSVSHGSVRGGLSFVKSGMMSGVLGVAVTADTCLRLGEAAADFKRVAIGWHGGEAARVMAEAFGCGVCAAGGDLIRHDGNFLSCAAYAGQLFGLPLTVFAEEKKDGVSFDFFGKNGGRISREIERKFEAALSEPHKTLPRLTGSAATVMGVVDAYVSAAVKAPQLPTGDTGALTVTVTGKGAENRALKSALALLGCVVSDRKGGLVVLEAQGGGMSLSVSDEEGYRLTNEQMMVLLVFVELSSGRLELAVRYDAPAAIEELAEGFGASVLRIGRDGPRAEELFAEQTPLRDGVFAGTRLCAFLRNRRETLSGLRKKMPQFSSISREIPLKGDRGAAMRLMLSSCAGLSVQSKGISTETAAGLRLDTDRGRVTISPLRERSALNIRTESMNEETAEELCTEFERRAREIDEG